ncbi:MAG: hypothetical protein WCV92_01415 [Candidatus Buchananbacteria bacterium]
MVCFNCKAQIPDTSVICPNCGVNLALAPAPQQSQYAPQPQQQQAQISTMQMQAQAANARTHHEIKKRRWQRWFFYLVIIVIFVAMVAYMVRIYMDNTKLLESANTFQTKLKEAEGNLNTATQNLSSRDSQIAQLNQARIDNQKELDVKMQELKNSMDQQSALMGDYDKYKELGTVAIGMFGNINKIATNISSKDLQKFSLADSNLNSGTDSDGDGLSDAVETALGTNPNSADTDGDKFSDKQEMLSDYDPLVAVKKLGLDAKFAQANKGKIFIQNDKGGNIWYIGPDAKRYFWGKIPAVSPSTSTPVTTSTTATTSSTSTAR